MAKVRLFNGEKVIGMVEYTDNLDHWDGHNWSDGSLGHHLGIGRLKDGRFYLCHGTQWQGEQDYAEVVDEKRAKQEVLYHDPDLYKEMFGEEPPDLTAKEPKKD